MVGEFRGPATSAEINSIVLADFLLPVLRHHFAVPFVVIPRGKIEMIEMHADAVLFCGLFQHPQTFWRHFLADTVARNDRDPVLLSWIAHRNILVLRRPAPGN